MSEEQRKEVGQEFVAEKTESLTEAGQTAEDAFLPDTSEKAIEREPQPVKKKISRNKKLGVLAAVAVVLAVLAVGLGIYNKPENRLARQLDLGNRYLEEQNYAEAVLAFEKAIQIDERCMAAYVNGIEAYRHLDEPENLLAFYEKALGAARSLEGEDLTADMDAVVSIYLAAEDVYTDREALIALWEEGYEKSGQDGRVRDSLVGSYLERAEERVSNGTYEESLQDYDRLLELDGQNETVLESLSKSLKSYLDFLLGEGNFDWVRELAEKYASALPDFDFAFYFSEIDRLEQERELEELRSQLELPFTAEDVTLFGHKLTNAHFDDLIAFLNLSISGNNEWSRYANDGSYEIRADYWDDDEKSIDIYLHEDEENYYVKSINILSQDEGYDQFIIYDRGLSWLQDHYADSYNLPLLSCLGNSVQNWYQAIPADKIKEIGVYDSYTTDYKDEKVEHWSWKIEEPVEVSFHEYKYQNGFLRSQLSYKYRDNTFSMEVGVNTDGVISEIWYVWMPW